jgi:hypothetical protein
MPNQGPLAVPAPRIAAVEEEQTDKGFVILPADRDVREDDDKDTGTQ